MQELRYFSEVQPGLLCANIHRYYYLQRTVLLDSATFSILHRLSHKNRWEQTCKFHSIHLSLRWHDCSSGNHRNKRNGARRQQVIKLGFQGEVHRLQLCMVWRCWIPDHHHCYYLLAAANDRYHRREPDAESPSKPYEEACIQWGPNLLNQQEKCLEWPTKVPWSQGRTWVLLLLQMLHLKSDCFHLPHIWASAPNSLFCWTRCYWCSIFYW